jgi:aspartate 1-decarboxylase
MFKSKIHGATLTGTELNYEGSITIDTNLLEKADILPGEQVHVLNTNNGQHFITYPITGDRNVGEVTLHGPAARCGQIGDKVIIISYGQFSHTQARSLYPKVVLVDDLDKVKESVDGA